MAGSHIGDGLDCCEVLNWFIEMKVNCTGCLEADIEPFYYLVLMTASKK